MLVVLEQDVGEPVDGAQRGAQVVADRVGERLELLVGLLERPGALGDPLLERGVEALGGLGEADARRDVGEVEDGQVRAVGLADARPPVRDDPLLCARALDRRDIRGSIRREPGVKPDAAASRQQHEHPPEHRVQSIRPGGLQGERI